MNTITTTKISRKFKTEMQTLGCPGDLVLHFSDLSVKKFSEGRIVYQWSNSWKAHGEQCFHFLVQHGEGLAFSSRIKDRMILATGP